MRKWTLPSALLLLSLLLLLCADQGTHAFPSQSFILHFQFVYASSIAWFRRSQVSGECRRRFRRARRSTEGGGQDRRCSSWTFNRFRCGPEVCQFRICRITFANMHLVIWCVDVIAGRRSRSRRDRYGATRRSLSSKRKCHGWWILSSTHSTVTKISSSGSWSPMLLTWVPFSLFSRI